MKQKRGKGFLIEGTDGSGKNTQAKRLVERLNRDGFPSEIMSFPTYDSASGRIVGQCYLGKHGLGRGDVAWFGDSNSVDPKLASVYYAANRLQEKNKILKILQSGKILVLDRYVESNMAHQGGKAKTLEERDEIIKWIHDLEYDSFKLPKPDLTIFLHMPYEQAEKLREKRGGLRDGHESNSEHLRKAEETYVHLAEMYGWEKVNCTHLGNIKSIEEISDKIYQSVRKTIKQ
jgi:dTMP kinase